MKEKEKDGVNTKTSQETREDTLQFVGEILKNKRLDCSISMHDAEKSLNIRLQYLKAFESGDWSCMPEETYALAFLRQYAKYLKCNINESIDKLKSNDYTLNKPVTFPDPPVAPNRKWTIVFLVVLIFLFILFNVLNQQKSSILPSGMMQKHAQSMKEQQAAPELQNIHEITIVNEPYSEPESPHLKEKPSSELLVAPNKKSTPPKHVDEVVTSPATPTISQDIHDKSQVKHTHDYVFTARTDDVWLQVYEQGKTGKPLREALLKLGQSLKLKSEEILSITCGNPRALEITMDDHIVVASGTMAKTNKVLRHFILPRPSVE